VTREIKGTAIQAFRGEKCSIEELLKNWMAADSGGVSGVLGILKQVIQLPPQI
jgi:hypothetical protein